MNHGGDPAYSGEHRGDSGTICFVAPNAFNVLAEREDLHHVGGAEVQVVNLARGMRELGHQVSFITLDHGQADGCHIDDVRVFKTCGRSAGLPGLRFVHPRWTSLRSAMKRADADTYMQAGADTITGQVGMWCKTHGRRFCFLAMHDEDCRARSPYLTTWRERMFYDRGLRCADTIILQTSRQRELLRESRRLEGRIMFPCVNHDSDDKAMARFDSKAPRVLWLGRFAPQKRLDRLVRLARSCPDIQFDIVGAANVQDDYALRSLEEMRGVPNINLIGAVAHALVRDYYLRAQALVLTSSGEGFPSVFMEAWRFGLPTVSTVDVDGLIERKGLGLVSESVDGLAKALQDLFSCEKRWSDCSERARCHFLESHTPIGAARRLHNILRGCDGTVDQPVSPQK